MTFSQFLRILWAHRWVAISSLLVTVALTAGIGLKIQKRYTASAAVLVDLRTPDPVAGTALQGTAGAGYIATQVDIITGDRVARAVVKELRLEEDAALRAQWQERSEGRGSFAAWLTQFLQQSLDVKPSRESNVITIAFQATSPEFAAAAANAFAKSFLDVNLELKLEPARQYAAWFEGQTKLVRDKLESAQAALSEYQQRAGIVISDERLDFETAKLNETATQLTVMQAQTTDSQNKRNVAKADSVAEVMQSPIVNSLKTDIARVEVKLKESGGNLGPNHPQTLRTQDELVALKSRLAAETSQITASIDTTYQVGKQREANLQVAIADQKTRVLALNKQRDELNVLKRDVESAQRAFEAVSQRAAQTRLESLTNQTNVVTLSQATPPVAASSPKVLLNVVASVVVGAVLGVALALLLELTNRRVRSTEDLAEALGLPVLASISSSKISYARRARFRLTRPALRLPDRSAA